jgi:hypothetical protein
VENREGTDLYFMDADERALVSDALALIEEVEPDEAVLLADNLDRLARAADLVRNSPPVLGSWEARRVVSGSGETLLDLLCAVPDWDFDLHVPVRVIFGQAYLIAKINFLKALRYGLEAVHAPNGLLDRAEIELGQSIYSKLAEELFVSIVTDSSAERPVKVAAAKSLFGIWERRLDSEIDDFAPVLDSVWNARNKIRPVIGTTLGTHEFFRLLRECSDTRFLEYFEGDVPDEQLQAFEEFLFGLSWEQISTLRDRMRAENRSSVSSDQAHAALTRPPSWAPRQDGPQALYTSYKKRRVRAQYRVLTAAPGPRKTAEEFVMTSFLMRDGEH